MKKILIIVFVISMVLFLASCSMNEMPPFPFFEYSASNWRLDYNNRCIAIREGYILDMSHPYDEVETDSGYDCVFHLIRGN